MYTEPRYTKDLDLWLERTPDNARVVLRALHEFGFASTDLSVDDFTTPQFVVQLGVEPVRIDLLTDLAGLSFSDCWQRRTELKLASIRAAFIGLDDLIANKEKAGRPRDLADAHELRRRKDQGM